MRPPAVVFPRGSCCAAAPPAQRLAAMHPPRICGSSAWTCALLLLPILSSSAGPPPSRFRPWEAKPGQYLAQQGPDGQLTFPQPEIAQELDLPLQ